MHGCSLLPTSLALLRLYERFWLTSVEGIPSEVVVVRSDNGGEFNGGNVGKLCPEGNIKQMFTTADSPGCNGMAERGLAMIGMQLAAQARQHELGNTFKDRPILLSEAAHVVANGG